MDQVRRFERMKRCPFCAEDILVAAIKCKHCGSNLGAPEPAATPPPKSIWKRDLSDIDTKKLWSLLFVVGICFWLFGAFDSTKQPPSAAPTDMEITSVAEATPPPPSAPPALSIPPVEGRLIQIISSSQQASRTASNDMQKGGAKHRRDKDICSLMTMSPL
jgi:hypothetical protein